MKSEPSIRLVAGPSIRGRRRGTLDVVYSMDAPERARRFERIQDALLRGEINLPQPAIRLAAFLVAFDAIVTRAALAAALSACRHAYAWHGIICIDWQAPCGRIDRRHLSAWTTFVLAETGALSLSTDDTIQMLDHHLNTAVSDKFRSIDLDSFLDGGRAWLALTLEGPWFSHAVGAVPLAALPRSALARESSQRALYATHIEEEPEAGNADACIGLALDAYLSGGRDGGQWFVDEIMACCGKTKKRRQIVRDLLTIAAKNTAGPISSVILAWATDLAESGTPNDADISSGTVSGYVRAVARELLTEFRGTTLEELKSGDFDTRYQRIVESKSAGTQRTAASALSSWHYFLVTFLDVVPRSRSLHRDLPEPIPRANVLWPHEAKRISDWLESATGESRLILQARVAFATATAVRVRTNELFKLRIRNVRLINDIIELEICTAAADGGLKSPNSRRVQTVGCPKASDLLRKWKLRRQQELGMPADYLFGDPQRGGKTYAIGQMHILLNRLLKDATGDHLLSIHTLSHSWATQAFLEASFRNQTRDINAFDALSVFAGHGDSSMTIVNYVHRFEERIRHGIDIAVADRAKWPEIALFVTIAHDNYRQRLSRYRRSDQGDERQFKLEVIRSSVPVRDVPAADSGIATTEAETSALYPPSSQISLDLVVDVLTDISRGLPEDIIALRACRPTHTIVSISSLAKGVLSEIKEGVRKDHGIGSLGAVDDLRILLEDVARGRIDFARIGQSKLLRVREVLRDPSDARARNATSSWLRCYHRGYFSLQRPAHAAGFVDLLLKTTVPSSVLGIFHIPPNDSASVRLVDEVDALFGQAFAVMPLKKLCSARGGRPHAYLTIAGSDFKNNASSATLCMKGLNALMLAACVLSRVCAREVSGTNTREFVG